MSEQELLLAFLQFLAQKTGAKTQQELEAVIQQLGEEGLKQAYAEFVLMMQLQLVQAAKFGAKLNYIKKLRGQCPEGYDIEYFKSGGLLCKKCVKKQEGGETPEIPENPVDAFKCGRKIKKQEGGNLETDKPTKTNKVPLTVYDEDGKEKTTYVKDEATRDSILANKYNDLEVLTSKPGTIKKGKWIPDRTKAPYNKK